MAGFAGSERTFGETDDVLGQNRAASGAYRLEGGEGNDTYYIYDRGDKIVESSDAGTDTAVIFVTYALGANVENIVMAEAGGAITGWGNNRANVITGNSSANGLAGLAGNDTLNGGGGNDMLNGGLGNDILTGGTGADRFIFDSGIFDAATEVDTITDFESGVDTIVLSKEQFRLAATDPLSSVNFKVIASATATADADDRILYDAGTGNLYYDGNGGSAGSRTLFAHLNGAPAISSDDFVVV